MTIETPLIKHGPFRMSLNITRADSEFRKLVRDEKLLWDEIGPLIEEVAETDKIAFERLKTMLERVRNADI